MKPALIVCLIILNGCIGYIMQHDMNITNPVVYNVIGYLFGVVVTFIICEVKS